MDENEIKQELVVVEDKVNAIMVKDAETYELAGAMVLDLDGLRKKVVKYWEEPKRRAYEAHKAITEKEREMLRPIDEKRKALDRKISDYLTEERRRRDEEQRKLDEKRTKMEDRRRDRLMKRANAEREKGNEEAYAALMEEAGGVYVPPTAAVSQVDQTTRTDGGTISQRNELEIRIVDPMKLVQAVASGDVPIGVIDISIPKLKQHVKLFKLRSLPGCAIEERVAASFRRAK